MNEIVGQDPARLEDYLERTKNTICGRNPILLLLYVCRLLHPFGGFSSNFTNSLPSQTMKQVSSKFTVQFLDYSQSGEVRDKRDSSVSYAAGVVLPEVSSLLGASTQK